MSESRLTKGTYNSAVELTDWLDNWGFGISHLYAKPLVSRRVKGQILNQAFLDEHGVSASSWEEASRHLNTRLVGTLKKKKGMIRTEQHI